MSERPSRGGERKGDFAQIAREVVREATTPRDPDADEVESDDAATREPAKAPSEPRKRRAS